MTMTERRGGNRFRIPDGYLTTKEIAEAVGRSKDTVERWRDSGFLVYEVLDQGHTTVYIYKRDQLDVARQLSRKGGRIAARSAA
jgi:hypothetical protein